MQFSPSSSISIPNNYEIPTEPRSTIKHDAAIITGTIVAISQQYRHKITTLLLKTPPKLVRPFYSNPRQITRHFMKSSGSIRSPQPLKWRRISLLANLLTCAEAFSRCIPIPWHNEDAPWEIGHDDVMTWKRFPHYCPFVRRIHRLPNDSHPKGIVSVAVWKTFHIVMGAFHNTWSSRNEISWYLIFADKTISLCHTLLSEIWWRLRITKAHTLANF